MSVNRGSNPATLDELDTYEDMIMKNVGFNYELDSSSASASNGGTGFTASHQLDIDRSEVWELVALIPQVEEVFVKSAGNVGTTPGTAEADWQVYRRGASFESTAAETSEEDSSISLSFDANANDDPGLLYQTAVVSGQPFNDTTNGTGGSGTPALPGLGEPRLFRDWFGRGPLFDVDTDAIAIGANLEWYEVENENVRVSGRYKTYWDRYELEQPTLRDIQG